MNLEGLSEIVATCIEELLLSNKKPWKDDWIPKIKTEQGVDLFMWVNLEMLK